MTLKYLLDTNILSEAKRPQPNEKVMEKLRLYRQEIATATIVIHEMLYGCLRLSLSKKRQDIEDYINDVILAQLPLFDYNLKAAQYHAQQRARLSKVGKTPAFIDGQIASIALTNDVILVTNNVVDFQDFDSLISAPWSFKACFKSIKPFLTSNRICSTSFRIFRVWCKFTAVNATPATVPTPMRAVVACNTPKLFCII